MTGMELLRQCEKVSSKEDLADFICALRRDLKDNPHEWESWTLDAFLDSMEALIRSNDFEEEEYLDGVSSMKQTWRTLADILHGTKFYE